MDKDAQDRLVEQVVKKFQSDRRWVHFRRMGLGAMLLLAFVTGLWGFVEKVGHWPTFGSHIAVVSIKGEIQDGALASANQVIPALRRAFQDANAKLVVLEIDSPGGSPFESERINAELALLRQQHPKPVVAVINTMGASAAYLVAINADKIVAGRYSLVGSIGAVTSAWDLHGLAKRLDVQQETFASAPLKDMFNPLRPRTAAEKAKAQAMVNAFAQVFINEVRAKRGQRLVAANFASGEAWPGDEALAMGLIDEIGTIDEVAHQHDLELSFEGPVLRPGWLASFRGAVAEGVEQGVRALVAPGVEIR